jgi:hypothetical protein
MLELLAEATGGFMFTAREQVDRQNRDELSAAYARHAGQPRSLSFDDWPDLVEALPGVGTGTPEPMPVILDEFPEPCGPGTLAALGDPGRAEPA